MSAQPQRKPAATARNADLTVALRQQSYEQAQIAGRQAAIDAAHDRGANVLVYYWQTSDDRDAVMNVYYLGSDSLDVLACEMQMIDQRRPTTRERLHYEQQFDGELQAGSDLWLEVASQVWQQA